MEGPDVSGSSIWSFGPNLSKPASARVASGKQRAQCGYTVDICGLRKGREQLMQKVVAKVKNANVFQQCVELGSFSMFLF